MLVLRRGGSQAEAHPGKGTCEKEPSEHPSHGSMRTDRSG